jgi:cell division protein FtsB
MRARRRVSLGSPWVRWCWRLACAGILAGALAYIPFRVYRSDGYQRYQRMAEAQADLERGNAELRDENRNLRRDVEHLRGDLDAIEAVARDELGMVKPGEVVIQIDKDH